MANIFGLPIFFGDFCLEIACEPGVLTFLAVNFFAAHDFLKLLMYKST
jgi:hypothetical protein